MFHSFLIDIFVGMFKEEYAFEVLEVVFKKWP